MVMPDDGASPADADQPGVRLVGRRTNPEARMPLMEHIRELRNRIIKILVVVAIGAVIGWFLYPHVWAFLERPYCRVPQPRDEFAGKGCHLFVSTLFAGLFLKLKIAVITGVLITSPVWFYQLWAFIAPGLYQRERRWGYFFAGTAVPLFVAGGATAYFAMTKGIKFLLELVPPGVTPLITIDTYLGYALAMLAIFGIAFEVPLVFVLLNLAGVLTHERFRKMRRVIIFLVFAFAALFTPSPDPLSMLLLAVPCVVLVEMSEIFVWANDRRRARLGVQYPGMTAEEVARYGLE